MEQTEKEYQDRWRHCEFKGKGRLLEIGERKDRSWGERCKEGNDWIFGIVVWKRWYQLHKYTDWGSHGKEIAETYIKTIELGAKLNEIGTKH